MPCAVGRIWLPVSLPVAVVGTVDDLPRAAGARAIDFQLMGDVDVVQFGRRLIDPLFQPWNLDFYGLPATPAHDVVVVTMVGAGVIQGVSPLM